MVPSAEARTRRPRAKLPIAILALLVALTSGAFILGRQVRSPAQAIADAAAPAPIEITAPIEIQQLVDRATFRVDVQLNQVETIGLDTENDSAIVTEVLLEPGQTIEEGAPILAINGTRLFLLQGVLPMFRDITPYIEGPDVTQLQDALARLGFQVGERGSFDSATQKAAREFLETGGANLSETVDPAAVQALRDAAVAVELAEDSVATAQASLSQAESTRSAGITAAISQLELAETQADLIRLEGDKVVEDAEEAVTSAASALAKLEKEEPVDTEAVAAARQALDDAEDALELAIAQRDIMYQEADQTVGTAKAGLEAAKGTSISNEGRAVEAANRELDRVEEALADAQRRAGLTISRSWLEYAPTLPARVVGIHVRRGDTVAEITEPAIELSDGSLVGVASVEPSVAARLQEGSEVEVSDGSEVHIAVVSGEVEAPAGTDDESGNSTAGERAVRLLLTFLEPPPAEWRGTNLAATSIFQLTAGPVLTAPISAVYTDGSGSSYVVLSPPDGSSTRVPVETGAVAGGYVEISATTGELAEGDELRVGEAPPIAEEQPTGG